MSGRLIVIDGLDGSGKQTQTELLKNRLEKQGEPVRVISFPDYSHPSSILAQEYLAGKYGGLDEVSAYAASSFYSVDRYASYQTCWKQDYLAGYTILADRYTTSNIVHQASKLPREQWDAFVEWLEDFEYQKLGLPRPDAVIYLDMHPQVSRKLLWARYGGDGFNQDIHEKNLAYSEECRICAHYAADKYGWSIVCCSDEQKAFTIEEIAEKIYQIVKMQPTK